jgi:hypothetical protein
MILTPNCPSKPYYTAPPQISQKTKSTHRDLSLALSLSHTQKDQSAMHCHYPHQSFQLKPQTAPKKQQQQPPNLFKIFTKLFTVRQLFLRNLYYISISLRSSPSWCALEGNGSRCCYRRDGGNAVQRNVATFHSLPCVRPPARPRQDRLGSNHGHDTTTRLRYAAVPNPWPVSDTRKTGEIIPRKRKTGQDSGDLRKPGTTGHAPCGPKSVPNGSSEMAYTVFLLRCSVAVKCCETPLV